MDKGCKKRVCNWESNCYKTFFRYTWVEIFQGKCQFWRWFKTRLGYPKFEEVCEGRSLLVSNLIPLLACSFATTWSPNNQPSSDNLGMPPNPNIRTHPLVVLIVVFIWRWGRALLSSSMFSCNNKIRELGVQSEPSSVFF